MSRIDEGGTGIRQKVTFVSLRRGEIRVNLHNIPIYRQPFYEDMGFLPGHCPEAESYFKEALSIPIYPDMTENDLEYVKLCMEKVLGST